MDPRKLVAVQEPSKQETLAIKALSEGEATPEQQKNALKWIIEVACLTYDEPFVPGHSDVTHHRMGRRTAGLAIVREINIKTINLEGED